MSRRKSLSVKTENPFQWRFPAKFGNLERNYGHKDCMRWLVFYPYQLKFIFLLSVFWYINWVLAMSIGINTPSLPFHSFTTKAFSSLFHLLRVWCLTIPQRGKGRPSHRSHWSRPPFLLTRAILPSMSAVQPRRSDPIHLHVLNRQQWTRYPSWHPHQRAWLALPQWSAAQAFLPLATRQIRVSAQAAHQNGQVSNPRLEKRYDFCIHLYANNWSNSLF